MLLTTVVFLLILGVLVLVHELGHFIVAKRNGVGAEEFGFGFPPRLIGTYKDKQGKRRWVFGNKVIEEEVKHREETIYSINAIPLGGFVKIKGEDGSEKADADSFGSKSIWVRFKILAAGVTMNIILGVVLLTLALFIGMPEQIDDDQNPPGSKVIITDVRSGTPAKEAGIAMGDEVVAVVAQGQETAITMVSQFQELVKENAGKEITIKIIHGGDEQISAVTLTPREQVQEGEGRIGVGLAKTVLVKHGLLDAFWNALQTIYFMVFAILSFLKDLIVAAVTPETVQKDAVAGPVRIAVLTGQAVRMGLAYVLNFAALLSINLAVINFLPFPALDGGRALFLLIEKIKGSPVSEQVEGMVHTVGFVFLLGLMALVITTDILSIGVVEKIKGIF